MDHQPLVQLTNKPLCEVSPRLQPLLLKVTQYNFNTIYVKHDCVPVVDCLSHNVQAESALEDEIMSPSLLAACFKKARLIKSNMKPART